MKYHDILRINGQIQKTENVIQWLIEHISHVHNMPFGEPAERGIVRVNDCEGNEA